MQTKKEEELNEKEMAKPKVPAPPPSSKDKDAVVASVGHKKTMDQFAPPPSATPASKGASPRPVATGDKKDDAPQPAPAPPPTPEPVPAPAPVAEAAPPEPTYMAQHKVAAGDTLSGIALKYYGSAIREKWMIIYEANRQTIGDNPGLIRVGQVLNIPEL